MPTPRAMPATPARVRLARIAFGALRWLCALLLGAPAALADVRVTYLGSVTSGVDPATLTARPLPAGWPADRLGDPGGGAWWRVELPAATAPLSTMQRLPQVLYFEGGWSARITVWFADQPDPIVRELLRRPGPAWGLPMELPVLLPAVTDQPLILHLQVEGARLQRHFKARTAALDDYLLRSMRHQHAITASTTALLTLAVLAFVLARTLDNRNYWLVGLMACSLAVYVQVVSGSLVQTGAWSLVADYGTLVQRMSAVLAVVCSQAFIISFLELERRRRVAYRILQALSALQIASLTAGLVDPRQPPLWGSMLSNGMILVSILLILREAWVAVRAGLPAGRSVLWAWGPALALLLLWVLALEGLLPLTLDLAGLVYCGLALQVAVLLFGVGADSARMRRERDQAVEVAVRDPLTGALNRRALQQRLVALLAPDGPATRELVVGFVDLDHFKRINDGYGHAAGDDCLRELVARIQARLAADDVLARYGGEEFVLLLPGRSPTEARDWAEALRVAIADRPFVAEGQSVRVTASIGLAAWSAGVNAHDLLDQADRALYRAKQAGRNRVILATD